MPPSLGGGELGPHLTQCRLSRGLHPPKWRLDLSSRLATTDIGQKLGVCPFGGLGRHLTMWPGPRHTSVPSGILIHPGV